MAAICLTAVALSPSRDLPLWPFSASRAWAEGARVEAVSSSKALPLALDDAYEVEKVFSVLIDPVLNGPVGSPWLKAEEERRYFGAVNDFERRQRDGHSYAIHWKVSPARSGPLTVRFEYRQQKLGSKVQALESRYPNASGKLRTEFTIQGDEYHQDGAVTAWRVLLIDQGRVVGLQQSFLW
ncbi:MAG: hypothetical protein EBS01_07460 [Verrucomicrobia bacterium]|nr:hypothetical protein [Verrucomicrobiota bacterium]